MNPKSNSDLFIDRHLGLKANDEKKMLQKLGFNNIDAIFLRVIANCDDMIKWDIDIFIHVI